MFLHACYLFALSNCALSFTASNQANGINCVWWHRRDLLVDQDVLGSYRRHCIDDCIFIVAIVFIIFVIKVNVFHTYNEPCIAVACVICCIPYADLISPDLQQQNCIFFVYLVLVFFFYRKFCDPTKPFKIQVLFYEVNFKFQDLKITESSCTLTI